MKPKKNTTQTALLVGVLLLAVGAIAALNFANTAAAEKQIPAGHSADDGHNH